MLELIFALAFAEPDRAVVVTPAPAPVVQQAKAADPVTCKWVSTSGGHTVHACRTKSDWRRDQLERQRRVDDFQRRALTASIRR